MNDEQIIQFLQNNLDYMSNNDIFLWLFRKLGWMLAKGLTGLIDITKDLYNLTYALIDITSWTGLEDWISEFNPLISTILFLSLIVLGFMFMFGKNKKHNLLTSILIFGTVVTASTSVFSTLNQGVILFRDAVIGTEGVADGKTLVRDNLYDLLYIDKQIELKNMADGNRPQYEGELTDQDIEGINITETLSWDDVDNSDTKDILKKKLRYQVQGDSDLQDVSEGILNIGNEYYFRYKFNFWTYFLDAIAILIIFFCLSYKNVRISYEILVGRVLVTLKSADLSTKKKVIKLMEDIRDQYFALCFTAITIRSYFLFKEFIGLMTASHGITRGIVTIFVAFCVIDGSNIMQKFTGVDAGLSSMTGKLIAASHFVQAAVSQRTLHNLGKASGGGGGIVEKMSSFAQKTAVATGGMGETGGVSGTEKMENDLAKGKGDSKSAGGNGDTKPNGAAGEMAKTMKDAAQTGKEAKQGNMKDAAGAGAIPKAEGDPLKAMKQMDAEIGKTSGADGSKQPQTQTGENVSGGFGDPLQNPDDLSTKNTAAETQMNQDLETSGANAVEEENKYENASQNMNRMDQEMESADDRYDTPNTYGTTDTSMDKGQFHAPDANMFQKWEEKGQDMGRDSFAEGGEKMSKTGEMSSPERGEKFAKTSSPERYREEPSRISGNQNSGMGKEPKSHAESGASNRRGQTYTKEEQSHPTRISSETVGKDRYVGGEAFPKKGRRESKFKDSTKKKE